MQVQRKQVEKLESRYQQCSEEVNKGNAIIEKLQGQLEKQKEKLKVKNTVVLQQEQRVTQLQDASDQQAKAINDLKREKDLNDLKIKELEAINRDLKDKVTESQKLIESNNQSSVVDPLSL